MPGEEVLGLCQSWTLNNPEELWVNAVELGQDVASHHSNWTFVPDNLYKGEDGVWPCDERSSRQMPVPRRSREVTEAAALARHALGMDGLERDPEPAQGAPEGGGDPREARGRVAGG